MPPGMLPYRLPLPTWQVTWFDPLGRTSVQVMLVVAAIDKDAAIEGTRLLLKQPDLHCAYVVASAN